MTHSFFTAPGWISGPLIHEANMLVDAAAHWCSVTFGCVGFTVSWRDMMDDRLHWIRFYSESALVISGDWLSYVKEPTASHRYLFYPGYLATPLYSPDAVAQLGDLRLEFAPLDFVLDREHIKELLGG